MPFDKFVDIDKIDDDRRNSVMKSIRTINGEELKKLTEKIFNLPTTPGDKLYLKRSGKSGRDVLPGGRG